MADKCVPDDRQPAGQHDSLKDETLVKAILTVLVLCFARHPDTLNGELKPYTPGQAKNTVESFFKVEVDVTTADR